MKNDPAAHSVSCRIWSSTLSLLKFPFGFRNSTCDYLTREHPRRDTCYFRAPLQTVCTRWQIAKRTDEKSSQLTSSLCHVLHPFVRRWHYGSCMRVLKYVPHEVRGHEYRIGIARSDIIPQKIQTLLLDRTKLCTSASARIVDTLSTFCNNYVRITTPSTTLNLRDTVKSAYAFADLKRRLVWNKRTLAGMQDEIVVW